MTPPAAKPRLDLVVRALQRSALRRMVPSLASIAAAGVCQADTLPIGFVRLSDHAPSIAKDIRYARAFNFTGARVHGYDAPECILTETTARALIRVEERLAAEGFGLVVFDCYRPVRAVRAFAVWAAQEATGEPAPEEGFSPGAIFFPGLSRADLIPERFVALRSGHSVGHTVDVGLRRADVEPERPDFPISSPCTAPFAGRYAETGLDMGTNFDCFSPLSAIAASVSQAAQENRRRLAEAMTAEGFRGYAAEWWHFRNMRDTATTPQDFPVR